ncbi:MAG: alpha/beta hydrolase [Clostridia bacterium]|nr:alpha/beta hydrolase [Clostridia bacterium]
MLYWLIPLLILLGAALFAADYFFKFAVVRAKPPKKKKKSMSASKGLVSLDEYKEAMAAGEAWIKAQNPETVHITSHDGLKLAGHYIDAGRKRTLILVHGYRSRAYRDFSCVAEYYHSLGFNLLLIDQRAHGESEGKYITFGIKERFDCVRWAEYIDQRVGGEIFLDGISMGAGTVLMASAEKLPGSVHGILADCGFTSPGEIMLKVMETDLKIRCRPLFWIVAQIIRLRAGFGVYEFSTPEAMKVNRLPVFFLHGTDDKFVPCRMTEEAHAACTAEKTLLLIEGAGHGTSYLKEPERCKEALRGFLEKYSREG